MFKNRKKPLPEILDNFANHVACTFGFNFDYYIEDDQFIKGNHLHLALLHLKETTEFDIEDVGYINYVFNALCNQEIPYLDVKEHQILTDGSVEF